MENKSHASQSQTFLSDESHSQSAMGEEEKKSDEDAAASCFPKIVQSRAKLIMNKPLQVSLLSRHITSRGGLEKWTGLLANGFMKKGADVTIFTSDRVTNPTFETKTFFLTRWSPSGKMKQFDRLCKKWNDRGKADIIFGMDRTSGQTHLRAGNGVHAAYLERRKEFENYFPFFNPLNRTILGLEKKAFENPQLKVLFTNSHMVKREILSHYTVSPDKIEVVHNGANWHQMEKEFSTWVESKQKIGSKLRLDPNKYHFLFVGNGYERKGLTLLLHALKTLTPKEFHLSVVGRDREIKKFIAKTKALGLEKHVTFFGPKEEILPFYQLADSLVIPSIYDPFANVTVEALSMGLFIVSSKMNGGHEILKEENGTVIEELKTPDSFKESLSLAMSRPKTWTISQTIRESVKYLDLSNQLSHIIEQTIENL